MKSSHGHSVFRVRGRATRLTICLECVGFYEGKLQFYRRQEMTVDVFV